MFARCVLSSSSCVAGGLRKAGLQQGLLVGGDTFQLQTIRNATKKAGGSTKNGRDSPGQRLGVKKFGGERVEAGNIIIRQRGQKFRSGELTKMGRDHTVYAVSEGYVVFSTEVSTNKKTVSVSLTPPMNVPLPRLYVEEQELAALEAEEALEMQQKH